MNLFNGSPETTMLLWATVLGLVQLVIATMAATRDQGLPYNLSARDLPAPPVSVMSGRLLCAVRRGHHLGHVDGSPRRIIGHGRAALFLGAACLCAGLCIRHHRPSHHHLGDLDRRACYGPARRFRFGVTALLAKTQTLPPPLGEAHDGGGGRSNAKRRASFDARR